MAMSAMALVLEGRCVPLLVLLAAPIAGRARLRFGGGMMLVIIFVMRAVSFFVFCSFFLHPRDCLVVICLVGLLILFFIVESLFRLDHPSILSFFDSFIIVSFLFLSTCLPLLNLPFLGANRFAGKGDHFLHLIRYHHHYAGHMICLLTF
jgi:hypothetical protein